VVVGDPGREGQTPGLSRLGRTSDGTRTFSWDGGESGPDWETAGSGIGNGKTAYQTPTYGGATPVR